MSAAGILAALGGGTIVAGFVAAVALDRRRRRASICTALGYDLSAAVEAHIRRTGASRAEAERLDRESRRWFVVAAAASGMIGMGSRAVDEYWHTLLDVGGGALYAGFSEAVARRWVEHVEGVGSADLDAKAWVAYEAVWGEPPPADLFPEPCEKLKRRYRARADHSSGGGGDCGGSAGDVSVSVSSCSGGSGGGGSSCGGGGCGSG